MSNTFASYIKPMVSDVHWNKEEDCWDGHDLENAFTAGEESRQAEIDELRGALEKFKEQYNLSLRIIRIVNESLNPPETT